MSLLSYLEMVGGRAHKVQTKHFPFFVPGISSNIFDLIKSDTI